MNITEDFQKTDLDDLCPRNGSMNVRGSLDEDMNLESGASLKGDHFFTV